MARTGSSYPSTDAGWQTWQAPFGGVAGSPDTYFDTLGLDYSVTVSDSPIDLRMAIYTIDINPNSNCLELTLTTQPVINDFVQVLEGTFYRTAYLYYPSTPGEGLSEISWLFLPTVVGDETVFDENSLKFVAPVDMYNPTDTYDKYLVFPKSNILV